MKKTDKLKMLFGSSAIKLGYGAIEYTDSDGNIIIVQDKIDKTLNISGHSKVVNNSDDNRIYVSIECYTIVKLSNLKTLRVSAYNNEIYYSNGYWIILECTRQKHRFSVVNQNLDTEYISEYRDGIFGHAWMPRFRKKDKVGVNAIIQYITRASESRRYTIEKINGKWVEAVYELEMIDNNWKATQII